MLLAEAVKRSSTGQCGLEDNTTSWLHATDGRS